MSDTTFYQKYGKAFYAKRTKAGNCIMCLQPFVSTRINRRREPTKQCDTCAEKRRLKYQLVQRPKRLALKAEVIAAYGGQCVCCGESHPAFLALDHIEGKGREHRRAIGTDGSGFYTWVKANNFPDMLRILCHNCNMGRQLNGGTCPHQEASLAQ